MFEEELADANAFMQLMYEQNSEFADLIRVPENRAAVISAEVSAVQDFDAPNNPMRRVETLDRGR